ncbi:MAG TPA: sulfite exporter TauE/SafE family protein [Acidimicrobiales bacterium]
MTGGDAAVVVLACFAAGVLNAVAGGGSLVSFPALVATGLSALTANVSNTLALWPGYAGGAASLARDAGRSGDLLRVVLPAALVGAVAGSGALLVADAEVFDALVPYLVLLAAVLLAVPARWLVRLRHEDGGLRKRAASGALAVGGAYGAYFGGALGVVLLGLLNAFVGGELRQMNAVKNVLSLVINTVALVAFIGFAPVDWPTVALGAPASLAGGLAGGAVSTRLNPVLLRRAVVAYALVAGIVMLVS